MRAGGRTESRAPARAGLYVPSNWLACANSTTCTAWRNNAQYGPDVEVWARLSVLPGDNNQLRLLARVQQPGTGGYDGYMLRPNQLPGTDQILFERVDNGNFVPLLTVNQDLVAGDLFLLRVKGSIIEAWRQRGTQLDAARPRRRLDLRRSRLRRRRDARDDRPCRRLRRADDGRGPPDRSLGSTGPAGNGRQRPGLALLVGACLERRLRGHDLHALPLAHLGRADDHPHDGPLPAHELHGHDRRQRHHLLLQGDCLQRRRRGPPSNEVFSTPSAPATAPSAPQGLQATAGNAQVSLSWSAPASNGGSALTTYTLYRSLTSGGPTTTLTTAPYLLTSFTDTTAANGTTYYYKVTASNAVGEGPPSNEVFSTPSAPATAPSAPQGLQATAGNAQVSLSWSAPASNGGSALTTYTLYRSLTSGGPTTTLTTAPYLLTSFTDTTAANGTTYYYKVTASNAVGESPASNEVFSTPSAPATAPSAPQGLQATAGNAQVSLSWSAPASNGGSQVTGYRIYRSTSSGSETLLASPSGTGTSYPDTSAVNGTTYYYKVSALNAVGEGPLSNEASGTPVDLVPPVEPLSILDPFNRANENPLSFGGRWGNGILGGSERSLMVVSNQCASDRNTLASAWWKTQLGGGRGGLRDDVDASGQRQLLPPLRASAVAGVVGRRRLHAPLHPGERHRPGDHLPDRRTAP